jgi:uncharacterized protein (TIGR03032 family)
LLAELGLSVWVTTYQAGKLVVLRADQGVLNTHFRTFDRPMGLAAAGNRLALGTTTEIREFQDVPAAGPKLKPSGPYDACYLPRRTHATADIQVHEMAYAADGELWFVNTAFSCLCTRSADYSFVPRWRPSYISGLTPEDRCHLNGLGMVGGVPRFVTALGETDDPAGWRKNKKDGGILIDIQTNRIIARGLSMPHSPRWHEGRLWVLNSGSGGLGTIDPASGRYTGVAELPGFTRGLDFYGRLAFVGLSQVRESAVFSGIAITERPAAERACGVWVVDVPTGQTVAFVKFEDAVQEIFAVGVLPGRRYPDLVSDDAEILASSYVLPDEALADVPPAFRSGGQSNSS